MSEDKRMASKDYPAMAYETVVKAAWASDPDFVELCKAMYGPQASVADVLHSEHVAKWAAKKKKRKLPKAPMPVHVIERPHGKGKAFAAGLVLGAAAATDPHTRSTLEHHDVPYIYKSAPDQADVHVPGGHGYIKRKKKPPVYDDRGIGKARERDIRGLGHYQYRRDDHGRFSSGARVAGDAAVAGGVGVGLGGYTGGKAVGHLNTLVSSLKDNPKGRRALLRTLKLVGSHGGKAAGLGGAAALMGTLGGHHGKQAFNELKDQAALEHQHRQDIRYATGEMVMDELEGKPTNRRVITRHGDKVAVSSVEAPGATKYKQFGKNASVDMGGAITEIDEDKRQVFGWASITKIAGKPVVDLQGDYIADDELEKAAYQYVHKSRVGGAMHIRVDEDGNVISKNRPYHAADLIESVVLTDDKVEKMGIQTDRTGWWVGFQVNDEDVWGKVKSGDWKGFSIHGQGRRTPTSLDELRITDAGLGR